VIEGMVALYEVFPYDFDLSVVHGGHRYLIEDCYCLEPGCDCGQFVAHVVDMSEASHERGIARRRPDASLPVSSGQSTRVPFARRLTSTLCSSSAWGKVRAMVGKAVVRPLEVRSANNMVPTGAADGPTRAPTVPTLRASLLRQYSTRREPGG
jgi:hypothetical protein